MKGKRTEHILICQYIDDSKIELHLCYFGSDFQKSIQRICAGERKRLKNPLG